MYIKSIHEAASKAVSEAGEVFKGHDIEKIIKEACQKGSERVSWKMPLALSEKQPWLHINSTITADRLFEIFVIVDLSRATSQSEDVTVYRGVFTMERPRPAFYVYEKMIKVKIDDYKRYTHPAACREFAEEILRKSDLYTSPGYNRLKRSLHETVNATLSSAEVRPMEIGDAIAKLPTSKRASVFETEGYFRSYNFTAPPGIVDLLFEQHGETAVTRINESVEMQLMWELDGDQEEIEAVKVVSKVFGGLFLRLKEMFTNLYYEKSLLVAEGKSYALAHVREAAKHAEVRELAATNPIWGSW
ncbi:TPA: hypothetical protein ACTYZB_004894 [Klebsiella variicola]